MTQAFNLSQLANKVNTSGQLDASTGLVNITPVANGGTGRSSVTAGRLLVGAGTSAMTLLAGAAVDDVVSWNGTAWVSAAAAGGAAPTIQTFIAPGTYTKPAAIKGIKVIVIGGGGNGGSIPSPVAPQRCAGGGGAGGAAIRSLAAPALPGPVAITAGAGTNSFGAFASATGGGNGSTGVQAAAGGNGGNGSSGTINIGGGDGGAGVSGTGYLGGTGGSSILGGGGRGAAGTSTTGVNGQAGNSYGGGGGGCTGINGVGGTGASGIVIVEEFY